MYTKYKTYHHRYRTWIESCLYNRSIKVVMYWNFLRVLDPLLFSIFIDDLLGDECENTLYLYADDSTLFCELIDPSMTPGLHNRESQSRLGKNVYGLKSWKWRN